VGSRALKKAAPRPARRGRPAEASEEPRLPGRPAGASGDQTRERVVAAALETFAEQGFAGTSVRDIARKARIRVSSLYHYFPSKESLYHEVAEKALEEWRELILSVIGKQHDDLRAKGRESVGKLFDFFVANPAIVQLGFRNRLEGGPLFDRRSLDRWLGFMEATMKPAQMQGLMKAVDPVPFIITCDALLHWHAAHDAFYRIALGRGLDDPEVARRVREHVIQVVLRTVGLE